MTCENARSWKFHNHFYRNIQCCFPSHASIFTTYYVLDKQRRLYFAIVILNHKIDQKRFSWSYRLRKVCLYWIHLPKYIAMKKCQHLDQTFTGYKLVKYPIALIWQLVRYSKGTFYSEDVGEMVKMPFIWTFFCFWRRQKIQIDKWHWLNINFLIFLYQ